MEFPQSGANLFLNGIVLGTVGIGGSLLSSGQIKAGDLMAFLVATQTIQRSLAQLSLLFGHYVRGTSAGSRVFEVIFIYTLLNFDRSVTNLIISDSTSTSSLAFLSREAKLFPSTPFLAKWNSKMFIFHTRLAKIK